MEKNDNICSYCGSLLSSDGVCAKCGQGKLIYGGASHKKDAYLGKLTLSEAFSFEKNVSADAENAPYNCFSCGYPIKSGAIFCPHCGTVFGADKSSDKNGRIKEEDDIVSSSVFLVDPSQMSQTTRKEDAVSSNEKFRVLQDFDV